MLKIKENIPLEKLEEYGFKKEKDCITDKYSSYVCKSTRVWFYNRKIVKHDAHFSEYDLDTIYDLIQDGLVEKVEE